MSKDDLEKEYLAYLLNTHGIEKPFNPNNDNDYTRFLERKLITEELPEPKPKVGLRLISPKYISTATDIIDEVLNEE